MRGFRAQPGLDMPDGARQLLRRGFAISKHGFELQVHGDQSLHDAIVQIPSEPGSFPGGNATPSRSAKNVQTFHSTSLGGRHGRCNREAAFVRTKVAEN